MNSIEAGEVFENMSFERGKQVLKPSITDRKFIIQTGASRLLVELLNRTGIDPIAVAADALEDINYHEEAAKLRAML